MAVGDITSAVIRISKTYDSSVSYYSGAWFYNLIFNVDILGEMAEG